jgi:hypothetical protein
MIDAIVISNQSVGQAAQFEKTIPIRIVARQTLDFKAKNNSHVAQRNFADHARETGPLICAGSGETKVIINNDDLILLPAELTGSVCQRVLARRGFAVVFDLGRGRLPDIYIGGTRGMGWFDSGEVSH